MTKTINPDVAAFKDDFFKGLSFRECVFGASALLTGSGRNPASAFLLWCRNQYSHTLCMPAIGIIGLCGFYHKNGMTLVQFVRGSIKLIFHKHWILCMNGLISNARRILPDIPCR